MKRALCVQQRKYLLGIALVLAAALGGAAIAAAQTGQQPNFSKIDAFVESQMRAHRTPGLALAITKDNEVVHLRGFGSASGGREMTPQTRLYIGSVSKIFTALAIMQLVEAGKIDLDAPVQTYIPWFQIADREASSGITVRHLLYHISGLSENLYQPDVPDDATLEEAVRMLRDAPLAAPVGTTFNYFNLHYDALGLIVEVVSGQSYAEYVQEHIFEPLAMDNSFAVPEEAERAGVAQGHTTVLGFPMARGTATSLHDVPSGRIVSTVEDMAHYLVALNNGGRYGEAQILSAQSIETMRRLNGEIGSTYAMGWEIEERDGVPIVRHGGDLPGWHADVVLLPEQGYGIAMLINQNGLVPALTAWPGLKLGVVDLLLGKEPTTGMAMSTIYLILTVIMIITVGSTLRSLLAIRKWGEKARGRPVGNLVPGIAWDFILPLALFFGLPAVLNAVVPALRFSWQYAFDFSLDLMVWLFFSIIATLARGVAKVWIVAQQHQGAPVGEQEVSNPVSA